MDTTQNDLLADNYNSNSQSILTASEILMKLMPHPVFLPDEDADKFKAFHQSFIEATNPTDIIEHVFVQDIAYYTWDAARYWRQKVSTIKAARREAAEKILFLCLFDGKRGHNDSTILARTLADGLSSGKEPEHQMAKEMLEGYGHGESEIQSVCYSLRIKELESIDKSLNDANYRRNQSIRELERHQDNLAKRAREHSDQVISEAEIVEGAP